MFPDAITKGIPQLVESTDTLSGAIYSNTEILKSPMEDLVTAFNKTSKKTEGLTKALVFWTKIMALAIIGQIIAIVLTNLN